jgi:hypothetical protein
MYDNSYMPNVIKEVPGGYKVFSKAGRPLSKKPKTYEAALRQLRAVERSKAMRARAANPLPGEEGWDIYGPKEYVRVTLRVGEKGKRRTVWAEVIKRTPQHIMYLVVDEEGDVIEKRKRAKVEGKVQTVYQREMILANKKDIIKELPARMHLRYAELRVMKQQNPLDEAETEELLNRWEDHLDKGEQYTDEGLWRLAESRCLAATDNMKALRQFAMAALKDSPELWERYGQLENRNQALSRWTKRLRHMPSEVSLVNERRHNPFDVEEVRELLDWWETWVNVAEQHMIEDQAHLAHRYFLIAADKMEMLQQFGMDALKDSPELWKRYTYLRNRSFAAYKWMKKMRGMPSEVGLVNGVKRNPLTGDETEEMLEWWGGYLDDTDRYLGEGKPSMAYANILATLPIQDVITRFGKESMSPCLIKKFEAKRARGVWALQRMKKVGGKYKDGNFR